MYVNKELQYYPAGDEKLLQKHKVNKSGVPQRMLEIPWDRPWGVDVEAEGKGFPEV